VLQRYKRVAGPVVATDLSVTVSVTVALWRYNPVRDWILAERPLGAILGHFGASAHVSPYGGGNGASGAVLGVSGELPTWGGPRGNGASWGGPRGWKTIDRRIIRR
jgi:hypothetical protein